jgi:hypothetical protein
MQVVTKQSSEESPKVAKREVQKKVVFMVHYPIYSLFTYPVYSRTRYLLWHNQYLLLGSGFLQVSNKVVN